jgi:hypothetical protein
MAMAKCAEIAKKPPLKMASKSPTVGATLEKVGAYLIVLRKRGLP